MMSCPSLQAWLKPLASPAGCTAQRAERQAPCMLQRQPKPNPTAGCTTLCSSCCSFYLHPGPICRFVTGKYSEYGMQVTRSRAQYEMRHKMLPDCSRAVRNLSTAMLGASACSFRNTAAPASVNAEGSINPRDSRVVSTVRHSSC